MQHACIMNDSELFHVQPFPCKLHKGYHGDGKLRLRRRVMMPKSTDLILTDRGGGLRYLFMELPHKFDLIGFI